MAPSSVGKRSGTAAGRQNISLASDKRKKNVGTEKKLAGVDLAQEGVGPGLGEGGMNRVAFAGEMIMERSTEEMKGAEVIVERQEHRSRERCVGIYGDIDCHKGRCHAAAAVTFGNGTDCERVCAQSKADFVQEGIETETAAAAGGADGIGSWEELRLEEVTQEGGSFCLGVFARERCGDVVSVLDRGFGGGMSAREGCGHR